MTLSQTLVSIIILKVSSTASIVEAIEVCQHTQLVSLSLCSIISCFIPSFFCHSKNSSEVDKNVKLLKKYKKSSNIESTNTTFKQ